MLYTDASLTFLAWKITLDRAEWKYRITDEDDIIIHFPGQQYHRIVILAVTSFQCSSSYSPCLYMPLIREFSQIQKRLDSYHYTHLNGICSLVLNVTSSLSERQYCTFPWTGSCKLKQQRIFIVHIEQYEYHWCKRG